MHVAAIRGQHACIQVCVCVCVSAYVYECVYNYYTQNLEGRIFTVFVVNMSSMKIESSVFIKKNHNTVG